MKQKKILRGIYYCIVLMLLSFIIISLMWLGLNVFTATGGQSLFEASLDAQIFVFVGVALIACLLLQLIFACLDADGVVGTLLAIITLCLIGFGTYQWNDSQSAFLICLLPTVLFFLLTTHIIKKGN